MLKTCVGLEPEDWDGGGEGLVVACEVRMREVKGWCSL